MLYGDEIQIVGFVPSSDFYTVRYLLHLLGEHEFDLSDEWASQTMAYVTATNQSVGHIQNGDIVSLSHVHHDIQQENWILEQDCTPLSFRNERVNVACFMTTSIQILRLLDSYIQSDLGQWVVYSASKYGLDRYLTHLAKRRGLKTVGIVNSLHAVSIRQIPNVDHVLIEEPTLIDKLQKLVQEETICLGVDSYGVSVLSILNGFDVARYCYCPISTNIDDMRDKPSSNVQLVFSFQSSTRTNYQHQHSNQMQQ